MQRKWNEGKMCHRKVFGVSEQIIVEVEAFKVHIKFDIGNLVAWH